MSAGRAQTGFTYLGILISVAIMGAGLAAFAEIASHAAQREKEAELLFRGEQYRRAIASYYKKEQRYPKALADLVLSHTTRMEPLVEVAATLIRDRLDRRR